MIWGTGSQGVAHGYQRCLGRLAFFVQADSLAGGLGLGGGWPIAQEHRPFIISVLSKAAEGQSLFDASPAIGAFIADSIVAAIITTQRWFAVEPITDTEDISQFNQPFARARSRTGVFHSFPLLGLA
jgi:hypothetical protein